MARTDARTLPLDETSTAALAQRALLYRLVDPADPEALRAYSTAEARGFLGEEPTDDEAREFGESIGYRRRIGVYDEAGLDPQVPVATVNSWVGELSVPGDRVTPFWAISGVTVSPARRRRGIARAMLEGELRTAHDAGVAVAGLTVSEATIYGRFGFAPAVEATTWDIDTRRAGWRGGDVPGSFDYVRREEAVALLEDLHERVRVTRPGDVDGWRGRWRQFAMIAGGSKEPGRTRVVRYADAEGVVRGAVVYRLTEDPADMARHTLDITYLVADGDEAYRALWGFVLRHDLVSRVRASLRSVDEPLPWLLADRRGAHVSVHDHEWLRILDVPGALAGRGYAAAGTQVIAVSDPLGFAEGTWMLEIGTDGEARVTPTDATPQVSMPVASLAALYLGGVHAATLRSAGQLTGEDDAVRALSRAFSGDTAPALGIWY
ncbi:MAG: GNAT family N-acetyltransferase [Microbacterium sp.]|uniref:GNAT family N-acetyltransferase n=1 Tax=Microbacterium sp. TaxID=51671 RepID=UPI002721B19E|nr:GNAT family N-acetyltransferase [Microbacterium sp.]MDO8383279.1 GNAT family N-acetyltransferase [Microbacterium sp.]